MLLNLLFDALSDAENRLSLSFLVFEKSAFFEKNEFFNFKFYKKAFSSVGKQTVLQDVVFNFPSDGENRFAL